MGTNFHHIFSVITAVIEGICFTGVIYGWPSLTYILVSEGYFRNLCEDPAYNINSTNANASDHIFETCNKQKESLVIVSSIGQASISLSHFACGFIYDKYGTMITRFIATIIFTFGCLIVAMSHPSTSWLLFPGMTLLSVGGGGLVIPNMKLGNLFVAKRATVISLMEGSIDASTIMFLFVKLAYQEGHSIKSIFLFMACSTTFQWIRTFFFMPQNKIPFPISDRRYQLGIQSTCRQPLRKEISPPTSPASAVKNKSKQPLSKSLKDFRFWLNVMHISILRLRAEMFISVFGDWLQATFPDDLTSNKFDTFINLFSIMSIFLIVLSLLNGLCCDSLVKCFFKKTNNEKLATSKATAIMLAITSVLGVLFSIAVCIPNLTFQYISFFLLYLLVAFLFGGHTSYIALTFEKEHFGRLFGLSRTISAIVSLMQYPLSVFVYRFCSNDFLPLHLVFIILCTISSVHPFILHINNIRNSDENSNKNDGNVSFHGDDVNRNPSNDEVKLIAEQKS